MEQKEDISISKNSSLTNYNNMGKLDKFLTNHFTFLFDLRHRFLLFTLLVLNLLISSDLINNILNNDIFNRPLVMSFLISGLISGFIFLVYMIIFLTKKEVIKEEFWKNFFSYFNSAFEIAIYVIFVIYTGNTYTFENSTLINSLFIFLLCYLGLYLYASIRLIISMNTFSQDPTQGIDLRKLYINAEQESFLEILSYAGILSICLIVLYIFTQIEVPLLLLMFLFLIHFQYMMKIYLTGVRVQS
ncbi:MAG: hypothetical protein ACMXYB_02650 [Candidatus Woesearchaeota archaeon]